MQVTSGANNKAFTNRIQDSSYQITPIDNFGYTVNTSGKPFGQIPQTPSGYQAVIIGSEPGIVNIPERGYDLHDGVRYRRDIMPAIDAQTIIAPYTCAPKTDNFSPILNCGAEGKGGMCIDGGEMSADFPWGKNFGKKCTKNSDCGNNSFCMGYVNPASQPGTYKTIESGQKSEMQLGRDRLAQIFAKEYGILEWNYSQGANSPSRWWNNPRNLDLKDSSGPPEGHIPTCAGCYPIPAQLVVKQVVFSNNQPTEGANGFSIKATTGIYTSGNIEVASPAAVSALFYAYNPNGEQMPLTEVRVDWNGTPEVSAGSVGKFKNHKHICQPKTISENTPNPKYTFGDSKNACIDDSGSNQGYFSFTRMLTCPENGEGLRSCDGANTAAGEVCWNRNALAGEGACEYRPRVYVKDNWEWCTNGRHGAGCALSSPAPWLNFDGKILVRP